MKNTDTATVSSYPTFRIYASEIDEAHKIAERFNRRAQRLASKGPIDSDLTVAIEVLEESLVWFGSDTVESAQRFEIDESERDAYARTWAIKAATIRVIGSAPRLAGWELLATIDHTPNGNAIRLVPGAEVEFATLDRFLAIGAVCEHCDTARRRNDTYLVREVDTGAIRQVGKSCLEAYLGGQSPAALIGMLTIFASLVRNVSEECAEGWGSSEIEAPIEEYLTIVATIVRTEGYLSRTRSREEGGQATADDAWRVLFPVSARYDYPRSRAVKAAVTDDDRAFAARALAAVRALAPTSDYEHNLRMYCLASTVGDRAAGYVSSAISWLHRLDGREAERARRARVAAESTHVGAVKERLDLTLTVEHVYSYDTDFGAMNIHLLADATGNVFVWKTGARRLEEGKAYAIRGTVKAHDEFKGTKQTVLTRCKAEPAA